MASLTDSTNISQVGSMVSTCLTKDWFPNIGIWIYAYRMDRGRNCEHSCWALRSVTYMSFYRSLGLSLVVLSQGQQSDFPPCLEVTSSSRNTHTSCPVLFQQHTRSALGSWPIFSWRRQSKTRHRSRTFFSNPKTTTDRIAQPICNLLFTNMTILKSPFLCDLSWRFKLLLQDRIMLFCLWWKFPSVRYSRYSSLPLWS